MKKKENVRLKNTTSPSTDTTTVVVCRTVCKNTEKRQKKNQLDQIKSQQKRFSLGSFEAISEQSCRSRGPCKLTRDQTGQSRETAYCLRLFIKVLPVKRLRSEELHLKKKLKMSSRKLLLGQMCPCGLDIPLVNYWCFNHTDSCSGCEFDSRFGILFPVNKKKEYYSVMSLEEIKKNNNNNLKACEKLLLCLFNLLIEYSHSFYFERTCSNDAQKQFQAKLLIKRRTFACSLVKSAEKGLLCVCVCLMTGVCFVCALTCK